jgi:hypothetical protein
MATLFKQYSLDYFAPFSFTVNTGTGIGAQYNLGRVFPAGSLSVVSFNRIINNSVSGTVPLYIGAELYKQAGLTSVNGFGYSDLPLSLHFIATFDFADMFYWTAGPNCNITLQGQFSIFRPKDTAA